MLLFEGVRSRERTDWLRPAYKNSSQNTPPGVLTVLLILTDLSSQPFMSVNILVPALNKGIWYSQPGQTLLHSIRLSPIQCCTHQKWNNGAYITECVV